MRQMTTYNTRQRQTILAYFAARGDDPVSIRQIAQDLALEGQNIGMATIYRHLEKLLNSGQIVKFSADHASGALYQYSASGDCDAHFHLKCEQCGTIVHLRCAAMAEVKAHIRDEHHFTVNAGKTILHGQCAQCAAAGGE